MAIVRMLGKVALPPTEEQLKKFAEESALELLKIDLEDDSSDDDIFLDEDCPPTTEEESDWVIHMMRKYNTRTITKELIELEKSQMTEEQRAAYDYMLAKKSYIIDILREHGGMTSGELDKYLTEHPFIPPKNIQSA